jgi:putative transposase
MSPLLGQPHVWEPIGLYFPLVLSMLHAMERKFFNPWTETSVGANRLPHWDQPGATYFVTFRLADALPVGLVEQWKGEREQWLKWNPQPWSPAQEEEYLSRFAGTVERWLDESHGECLLRRGDVRAAVGSILTRFHGERYWQHAWVLMPNHAHLLFSVREGIELPELLKVWKGASSRAARQALGRTMAGSEFWQKDYFDRLIRDWDHFWNCARYIWRNPGKGRLRANEYALHLSEEVRAEVEGEG